MFRRVILNKKLVVLEATAKLALTKELQWKLYWRVPRNTLHSAIYSLHRNLEVYHHHHKGGRLYSARIRVIGPDHTLVVRSGQAFLACHHSPPESSSESEDESEGEATPEGAQGGTPDTVEMSPVCD